MPRHATEAEVRAVLMGHNPIPPPPRLSADEMRDRLIREHREDYALGFIDLATFEARVDDVLRSQLRTPPRPARPAAPTHSLR